MPYLRYLGGRGVDLGLDRRSGQRIAMPCLCARPRRSQTRGARSDLSVVE